MPDLAACRKPPLIAESAAVRPVAYASRYVLRGGREAMERAGRTLGIEIAEARCRASVGGNWAALWLGPDERLLLGSQVSAGTQEALEKAMAGVPHSLVDVGHRQVAIEVSGPRAAALLNAGCPLDLGMDSFPVGMCTRTVLAKTEIALWRKAVEVFHLEVARSFAAHASSFLNEVEQELNTELGAAG